MSKSKTPVREKYTRLPEETWLEIQQHYEVGTISTIAALSEKYGVSQSAIKERFKSRGVVKNSRSDVIKESLAKKFEGLADEIAAKADLVRQEHDEWSTYIARMLMHYVNKGVDEELEGTGSIINYKQEINLIKTISSTLSDLRRERWEIHGVANAVDEKALPAIIVKDMTSEDIEDFRKNMGNDDEILGQDDDDLNLVIEDLEELTKDGE